MDLRVASQTEALESSAFLVAVLPRMHLAEGQPADGDSTEEVEGLDESVEVTSDSGSSIQSGQGNGSVGDGAAAGLSMGIEGEPILDIVVEDEPEDGRMPPNVAQWGHGEASDGEMQIEGNDKQGTAKDEEAGENPVSSEEEEDVLQLEGNVDHDQVALLPTTVQDVEDCYDVGPPVLPHLAIATTGEEATTSLSDPDEEDGERYEDCADEDEDEDNSESPNVEEDDLDAPESRMVVSDGPSRNDWRQADLGRIWMEKYDRLRAFKAAHGHVHVRQDEPLGAWVCVQRQKFKQGTLLKDRELMLKTLDFCFNGKQALDLRNKRDQRASASTPGGNSPPYAAPSPDSQLSCECTPRKHAGAMQLLGRSRRPRESTVLPWRVRLEQEQASRSQGSNERRGTRVGDVCVSRPAVAFPGARKREHGAKEQYAAAASSKQQSPASVSTKDLLHSDKNAAARWVEAQSRWERRFDELVLFRKKNGYNFETMNCSDKMAYCCELYWWTQNQRQVHRNGTIAANRLAKLDEIGFNWGGIEKTCHSSSCGDVGEKKLPVRSKSIDKPHHQEVPSGNRADRSVRRSEVWRESDCEKLNYMANMLMEGLVMQALGGPLSKMRGREAWLLDFLTALRSERKGFWHTDVRRVSQMLRSLETNLPWRTMSQIFRDERVPLLKSIKDIATAADVQVLLQNLTAFTKVECWRDGYRAYRLDVEEKIRPRGGWKALDRPAGRHLHQRNIGMKRGLLVRDDLDCPDRPAKDLGRVAGTCLPVTSSPNKRRRLAAASESVRAAQKSVDTWLHENVGLGEQLVARVMACLADEDWGVRTLKMLCALADTDVAEMLAPLQDDLVTQAIVQRVQILRPTFFAHVSVLFSSAAALVAANAAAATSCSSDPPVAIASLRETALTAGSWAASREEAISQADQELVCVDTGSNKEELLEPTPLLPPHVEMQKQKEDSGSKRRVAELRGKKMSADNTVWYLAHWEGCETEDDTWVPPADLGSDEWLVSEWEAEQIALRKPAISLK